MKNFSPFAVGIFMVLIIGLIMQLPVDGIFPKDFFSPFQVEYIARSLKMFVLFALSAWGIKKMQLKSLSGLSAEYKWTSRLLNLIPVYLFLLGFASFTGNDISDIVPSDVLLLLFGCLVVGFAEEFMFRGFLQPLFIQKFISRKNGIFLGVLFPASFFGATHLLNLIVNDNVAQVLVQSIYATFIGFFFGVLLLKTNKLVPLAITHGLINFFFLLGTLPGVIVSSDIQEGPQETGSLIGQIIGYMMPMLLVLPLFIVGLIVLRRVEKEEVLKKIER